MRIIIHLLLPLAGILFMTAGTCAVAQDVATGRITGRVLDHATQAPIPGVNVLVEGTQRGTLTGIDGRFSIDRVSVGTHRVRLSCVGYAVLRIADVTVSTAHPAQVAAELHEEPITLGSTVEVTASVFHVASEFATSAYGISYEEIRRQPGAVGDVSRMIQTMPGVVPSTDQRNDLIVRGGSPSENLTLVDNIEVPNISHFGTQGSSGGPINMLSAEFIREVDFSAGGFPARYGDRLSSVLDIRLREGNREQIAGTFDLGMAGAGFIVEGPVGERVTWMAAARKSYLDLIAGGFGLTAVPDYTNYQVKATYDPDARHRIWLVSFGGIDDIHFEPDQEKADDPEVLDINSGGWRNISGINWRWLWGDAGYGTLSLSDVLNVYRQRARDPRMPGTPLVFSNDSREAESTVKYDAMFHAGGIDVTAGLSARFLRAHYDISSPTGEENPHSSDSVKIARPPLTGTAYATNVAAYAQASLSPLRDLTVTGGLRFDQYGFIDQGRLSPRVALSYHLMPDLTVSASWGIFHQQPALVLLAGHSANAALDPMRARHWIAGVAWLPEPDLRLSIEVFRKEYDAYPVSTEFPSLSLANDGDSYTVNGRLIPLASAGSGRAEGVEFFVQKKLTTALYGQFSYTLSRVRHRALDGVDRPGAFDIPHVLYLVAGYRLNDGWEFSSKFSYASGRPRTPFLMPDSYEQNRWIWDAARVNSERMPDYTRLDLRADNRYHFSGWNLVTYLEVQNVLARRNVFMYVWNEKTRDQETVYQTGLFVVGGVKIEF